MSQGNSPQVRMLGAVPRVVLARLQMFFNTNKTFLLPTALPSVKKLRQIYADNSPGKLLVVGHADTKGGTAYNDKLSLERAQATIAYLEDDDQTWLDFYGTSVEAKKRWGKVEDRLMIISMPDFDTKPKGEDAVSWYQRTRKLTVDGKAGTETRTQLIQEYMSLDGASLADSGIEIEALAHGCGENFPLDDTGDELDAEPKDEKRDPIDRRVELFFFDAEFGIVPAPPSANSSAGSRHYPAWRKRVEETIELQADDLDGPKVTFVEMADAHFRTNSAVVLPEGEDPDESGSHQAFTSAGVIATALRFNDQHPGRTLLVAGHADTTGTSATNQPLSEERAQVTLALLKGGNDSREKFKELAQARHTVADIKQILSWVSTALAPLSFDCDPGQIDDNLATANGPVRNFQRDFNGNRSALGSSAPSLTIDGSVGLLTWGAFFDCYEFALQQALGADAADLQALRARLVFADPQHESLGFSEHFPVDELGVDNFRSQTNRRVEILFFESGEEPDVAHAAADPETSELYLPGHYQRKPLQVVARTPGGGFVFEYAVQVGNGVPWTLQASLVFTSVDNLDIQAFPLAAGVASGQARIVRFPDSKPGLKYAGAVLDGPLRVELFGPVELFRVADPNDDVNDLPIADVVAPLPEQPPDSIPPTAATGTQDGLPPEVFADIGAQPESSVVLV